MRKMRRFAALGAAAVLAVLVAVLLPRLQPRRQLVAIRVQTTAMQAAAQMQVLRRLIWYSAILMQRLIPGINWP